MKLGKKVNFLFLCLYLLSITEALSNEISDIYLIKGSHKSIEIPKGTKFVLSNKAILKAKVVHQNKLFIKGLTVGKSNITLLTPGRAKNDIQVIVADNTITKSMSSALEFLSDLGLQYKKLSRSSLKITNQVEDLHVLKMLYLIEGENRGHIKLFGKISHQLKIKIIKEVYSEFYDHQINDISCYDENISIICSVNNFEAGIKALTEKFKNKYGINFIKNKISPHFEFYELNFSLIQIQQQSGHQSTLGLDSFEIGISDLIAKNFNKLIEDKSVLLNENEVQLSLIAKPNIKILLNEKAQLKIGGEVPFQVNSANGVTSQQWKFFGISIDSIVSKFGGNYLIEHKFEFSSPPVVGSSQLSSSHSKTYIKVGEPTKLFEINLDIQDQTEAGITYLNQIPILENLFSSNNEGNTNKKVFAYVTLNKIIQEH